MSTTQRDLFGDDDDSAPARRDDPETSHGHLSANELSRLRREVLEYLTAVIEATELDAELHFGDHGSSRRSRFIDLERMNLIHRTDRVKHQIGPGKVRSTARQIWRIGPMPTINEE